MLYVHHDLLANAVKLDLSSRGLWGPNKDIYIRCWFFGTTRTRRCIIFPHPQISQISQESTLHLFGITTGVTAFVGMCRVLGAPSKRDVVVVSAAAGAVGSIAAQVAKSYGARVIGIAGGPLPLWASVTEVTDDAEYVWKDCCK